MILEVSLPWPIKKSLAVPRTPNDILDVLVNDAVGFTGVIKSKLEVSSLVEYTPKKLL